MVSFVCVRASLSASHHESWGGPIKTKLDVNSKVDTPTNIGYSDFRSDVHVDVHEGVQVQHVHVYKVVNVKRQTTGYNRLLGRLDKLFAWLSG